MSVMVDRARPHAACNVQARGSVSCEPGELGGLASPRAGIALSEACADLTNSSPQSQSARGNHVAVHWNHDMRSTPDRQSTGGSDGFPKPTGIQPAVRGAGGPVLPVSVCFL